MHYVWILNIINVLREKLFIIIIWMELECNIKVCLYHYFNILISFLRKWTNFHSYLIQVFFIESTIIFFIIIIILEIHNWEIRCVSSIYNSDNKFEICYYLVLCLINAFELNFGLSLYLYILWYFFAMRTAKSRFYRSYRCIDELFLEVF